MMTISAEITDERTTAALSSWNEWKERCALGLCPDDVRNDLQRFVWHQGNRFMFRYAHRVGAPNALTPPSPENMWHLFETHLTVRDNRQGKRYKEWLFARANDNETNQCHAVNGGAALLIRDVVREYLCREYSPENVVSMNAPAGTDYEVLTLADLLPGSIDTAQDVARREFERLADSHARDFLQEMSQREKIAFLTRELGISSKHQLVEELAGCKKSMLSQTHQASARKIAEALKREYVDEDNEAVCMIVIMTFDAISRHVREWASSDKAYAELVALEQKP